MPPSYGTDHHALVLGASGITGWAIVNELLNDYPAPGVFKHVTAITNRPLSSEAAGWPKDSRLQTISGIDLLKGTQEELEETLRQKIQGIDNVTEVFFNAYKFDSNPDVESRVNMEMLSRTVKALESLSKKLSYVVLPTGTKAYGVHLLKENFPFSKDLPLREDLPRIPEPWQSQMFYYYETDELSRLAEGKSWTWCEIRPDFVIGYVPNNNTYCLAQTLGIYLSLYAAVNGTDNVTVPFPGNEGSWKAKFNHSSQDLVARFSIHASLNPSLTAGRAFNVCDNQTPTTWGELWPLVCAWFNLKGTGPSQGEPLQPNEFISRHMDRWEKITEEKGLRPSVKEIETSEGKAGYQYFLMTLFDFDRQCDLEASREVGFADAAEWGESFHKAFERFRQGKALP